MMKPVSRQNALVMAGSGDDAPTYTNITKIAPEKGGDIQPLFSRLLLVCDGQGLIGRQMFAIDGVTGENGLGEIDTNVDNSHSFLLPDEMARFESPACHSVAGRQKNQRLPRAGEVSFNRKAAQHHHLGSPMPRYVAFLRGLSPMNAKMPALKSCFVAAGFSDVRTLLSSGNVVFGARSAPLAALEGRAEKSMQLKLDRSFGTFVRPAEYLRQFIESDPFAEFDLPPTAKRVVTFLRGDAQQSLELPIKRDNASILHNGRSIGVCPQFVTR